MTKLISAFIALTLSTPAIIGAAHAQNGVSLNEQAFLKCLSETEDNARRVCYDRVAGTLRLGLNNEQQKFTELKTNGQPGPSPDEVNAQLVEEATQAHDKSFRDAKAKEEKFGLAGNDLKKITIQKEEKLKKITSPVAEITILRRGRLKITLENGQVWRQLSSDSTRLKIRSEKDYTATVKKAALGSHRLILNDGRKAIRVKRIK